MAEHQDRNKVYIFKKTEDQPPSDYAYRRDWSRRNSYFLTFQGKDLKHFDNSSNLFKELEELRKSEINKG